MAGPVASTPNVPSPFCPATWTKLFAAADESWEASSGDEAVPTIFTADAPETGVMSSLPDPMSPRGVSGSPSWAMTGWSTGSVPNRVLATEPKLSAVSEVVRATTTVSASYVAGRPRPTSPPRTAPTSSPASGMYHRARNHR
jgi:hypothetical protein